MNNHQLIINYCINSRDELLAFVSSRLGNSMEAEDIVQDVFEHLLTTDKMITEVTLPALAKTMAHNKITDYYRHRQSIYAFEHYLKRSSDAESSMESVYSATELTELLERGIARIPENCREIYRMHIYGGMKVGEISKTLGEGYKSVEHRLGAARKALRTFLRNFA